MKTRKYILLLTVFVCLIAIANAMLFQCVGKEFEANLLIGVFSSSFLTMLISIIEYANERKETMERFYSATIKVLHVINQYRTDLQPGIAIDKVLAIINYDYSDLDTAFGALSFLFKDKKTRDYINTKIYNPILQFREELIEVDHHLSLYEDGVSKNEKVVREQIDRVTNLLMDISESNIKLADDAVVHYSFVRNELYNSIEKELNGHYWEIMYLTRKDKQKQTDKTLKEDL